MELSTFSILVFGFFLGLRHATEADHLAAVSTIVSEKKDLFMASVVGGLWGIGHTISLFAVGILVIVLKLQISETLEARLEACVGVMLVLLGLNALRKLLQADTVHVHTHEHDGRLHAHVHAHEKNISATLASRPQPALGAYRNGTWSCRKRRPNAARGSDNTFTGRRTFVHPDLRYRFDRRDDGHELSYRIAVSFYSRTI